MKSSTLIINHILPPVSGVAGRRWTLLSKYLINLNIEIDALTSSIISKEISPWTNELKINKEYYKHLYPSILSQNCNNFISKINYRIILYLIKFLSKGNFNDNAVLIKYFFTKKLSSIYSKKKYSNIIVSGAPFNLLYYSALFKQKNSEINLICDIRDPWTWSTNYGINTLSKKRKEYEKKKQDFVINTSNFITIPNQKMKEELMELYPESSHKFIVIPHGFDDKLISLNMKTFDINNKINFMYAGEIYNQTEHIFKSFYHYLNIHNQAFFNIYTNSTKINKFIPSFNSQVKISKQFEYSKIKEKIDENDFMIIILPKQNKNYIVTKILEFAALKIPIILISEEGLATQFIVENNFGICIDQSSDFSNLNNLIDNYLNNCYAFHDQNHILEEYSMSNIANKIFAILN